MTCEEDFSVFLRCSPLQKHISLVVYVDNIAIIGDNNNEGINDLKRHLFKCGQSQTSIAIS